MKLIKTSSTKQNSSVPYNLPYKAEIIYKDGTKIIEDYVVNYGPEIAIYASNSDRSPRKQTIYPWNDLIESIRWLDE